MQTISQKRDRFFATARELAINAADAKGAMVFRYERTSAGGLHTTFTASVVTGVPEARIQEVEHAVLNRIEQLHGAAAVSDHV